VQAAILTAAGRPALDWLRLHLGLQYFLLGLVKKLVIADRMALFAEPIFAERELYSSGALWLARWPMPCRSTRFLRLQAIWLLAARTCLATS